MSMYKTGVITGNFDVIHLVTLKCLKNVNRLLQKFCNSLYMDLHQLKD